MDPRALDKTELDAATTACQQRVRVAPGTPPDATATRLRFDALQTAVSNTTGTLGRGVVVFLGLAGTTIRFGITVVPWTSIDGDVRHFTQPGNPRFLVNGNLLEPIDPGDWAVFGNAYRNNVQLDRAGTFQPLNDKDMLALVMPWEDELLAMYDQNAPYPSGVDAYLTFSNIARHYDATDGGNAGYRHQVALNMATPDNGGFTEYLDNATHDDPFQGRAGDAGTGCPPGCSTYRMPK